MTHLMGVTLGGRGGVILHFRGFLWSLTSANKGGIRLWKQCHCKLYFDFSRISIKFCTYVCKGNMATDRYTNNYTAVKTILEWHYFSLDLLQ